MKNKKFERVVLDNKLRANTDGMPVFRECMDNETLMSFFDDEGNYAFNEYWSNLGAEHFNEWLKNSTTWRQEANF
jgi:hypothetical protein